VFSDTVLDHFQYPRNVGVIENPDAEAEDENPVCGDRLHLALRIQDGMIVHAAWRAEGCAPVIAAASVMSELLIGSTVVRAGQLDREAIFNALGSLPARKLHAIQLCLSVLRKALDRVSALP
jgi:nitrogen fixation protein NifU and related proteins